MLQLLRSPLPHQQRIESSVRASGGVLVLSDSLERWEDEELEGLVEMQYALCWSESCERKKEVNVSFVMRAERAEGDLYGSRRFIRRAVLILENVRDVPCLDEKRCRMSMMRTTIEKMRSSSMTDVLISTDRAMSVQVCFLLLSGSREMLKEPLVVDLSSSSSSASASSSHSLSTRCEQEPGTMRLLTKGLSKLLFPLVRFSSIALCAGTSVEDGECARTASRCAMKQDGEDESCSSLLHPHNSVAFMQWSALSQLNRTSPMSFLALLDGQHMNNLHVTYGVRAMELLVYEGAGAATAEVFFLGKQLMYVCKLKPQSTSLCMFDVRLEHETNAYMIQFCDEEKQVIKSSAGIVFAHPHVQQRILLPSSVGQDVCAHFLSPLHDSLILLPPDSTCVPAALHIAQGCLTSQGPLQLLLQQNSKRIVDFELESGKGGWQLWFPCVAVEEGYNQLDLVASSNLTSGSMLLADVALHVQLMPQPEQSASVMLTGCVSCPAFSWILPAGNFSPSAAEATTTSLRLLLDALDLYELSAEVIVVDYGEEGQVNVSHPRVRLLPVARRHVEATEEKIKRQREEEEEAACEEEVAWTDWNPEEERNCGDWTLERCVSEFLVLPTPELLQWMSACRLELRCSSLPTAACCSCASLLEASWPSIPGPSISSEHLAVALNLGAAHARGNFLLLLPGATFFPHELFETLSTGAFSSASFYRIPSSRDRTLLADPSYLREPGTNSICKHQAESSPAASTKFVSLLVPRQAWQVVGGLHEQERKNPLRYLALALNSWGYKSHLLQFCDAYTLVREERVGGYEEEAVEDYFYRRNELRVAAGDRTFLREEANLFSHSILQQLPPPPPPPPHPIVSPSPPPPPLS